VLVPKLISLGHTVTVLDLYLYGFQVFDGVRGNPRLIEIVGDLRHPAAVEKALAGCDSVIHLACISNDPSYELNPDLGKSINYDAFRPLVRAAKKAGVNRFIYASSSSVYGVKQEADVTEDLKPEPLTDYSKYKAQCEEVLEQEREPGFVTLTIRPSTVCGYAPRQRLDVIVNILTNQAVVNRKIKVFGGSQMRPNIHIDDMCAVYQAALTLPNEKIDGKVYNAGYDNATVMELAQLVKRVVETNTAAPSISRSCRATTTDPTRFLPRRLRRSFASFRQRPSRTRCAICLPLSRMGGSRTRWMISGTTISRRCRPQSSVEPLVERVGRGAD
jgi:nucleoside-diphosphate-sugar epimerase